MNASAVSAGLPKFSTTTQLVLRKMSFASASRMSQAMKKKTAMTRAGAPTNMPIATATLAIPRYSWL
jgi:hypothetical protein